jgi:hypothetical protein
MPEVSPLAPAAPGRTPLSVATLHDQDLLYRAPLVALDQAEREAAETARENPTLSKLRAAEVVRLRVALTTLIPGIGFDSTAFPARAM